MRRWRKKSGADRYQSEIRIHGKQHRSWPYSWRRVIMRRPLHFSFYPGHCDRGRSAERHHHRLAAATVPVGVTQTLAIAEVIRCKMETSIMRTTRPRSKLSRWSTGRGRDPLSFGSAFHRKSAELLEQSINSSATARQMPQRTGHFKR